ncbi:uncharacterized protein UTRI_05228 [Ustilago trichophora]|uniref:Uncharacterized protein n=1 Tax=Ustilago trichophora TaxID=86804 RepID=A0A5C3EM88_9BASI|nr:uncharacterized protein UTRI_05228 [Ustilago trichophora]
MSGLASLAGYGSDSDDDIAPSVSSNVAPTSSTAVPTPPTAAASKPSTSKLGSMLPSPKSGLASKLPPPSSPSTSSIPSKPSGSGLSLPPPTASTKRKVIKVDSLQSFKDSEDGQDSDEDGPASSESKRPRLGSNMVGKAATKHSLFGMLPAPKRKDDEVLAERRKEAEARKAARAVEESDAPALTEAPLRIVENVTRSTSPEESGGVSASPEATSSKAKGKNNDAFRAMLGLKPAAKKPSAPAPAPPPAPTTASLSASQTPASKPVQPSQASAVLDATANSKASPSSSKVDSAPVDFFSLGPTRASTSAASLSHTSSLSISAAPIIDHPEPPQSIGEADSQEDASEYPGWQLDPDGSWVPVTPEAQAQLLAYQQSLSDAPTTTVTTSSRGSSSLDGTRDLLAAGLTPDDILAFDASTAAREAYLQGNGDAADSDKYAAAAEFAAGNREVQQRKPGMLKGLRKGQLSSLVSLASENRAKLEERWQRGRDAQARRSNQYGW